MLRATQLQHLDRAPALRGLALVTQDHDVVDHGELLHSVPGDAVHRRALSRRQRRRTDGPQLADHRRERPPDPYRIRELLEQRVDRIEHQPLTVNPLQRASDPRGQGPRDQTGR